DAFARSIADAGFLNSLAQTVLKIACPGVPDFYQGSEFWDFNLVDPDNRRPVDFGLRIRTLGQLREKAQASLSDLATELVRSWPEQTIKIFVIWRALDLRRQRGELREGDYIPLVVEGARAASVISFARKSTNQCSLCVVPRFSLGAFREFQ